MTKNLRHARNLQVWMLCAILVVAGAATTILVRTISNGYDELLTRALSGSEDQARQIEVTFKKQVQNWKDILLRGRDYEQFKKYTAAFHDEETHVQERASALKNDLKSDPAVVKLIDGFLAAHAGLSANYMTALKGFEASKGVDYQKADTLVKGLDHAPSDQLDQVIDYLDKQGNADKVALDAFVGRAEIVGGSLTLVISLALGAYLVWMMASVTKRIEDVSEGLWEGAEQVASAAGQVATSAQGLSQGATEQAASLEETSASMEEMSSMTRKNAENSQNAAQLMAEVEQRVTQSHEALKAMIASMTTIQDSSNKVAKIIKTIDEIAFQTNILALNAAVEAARAGEVGMGFAVVADEVRNLAQRSAQAARDTATLIEESIANSKSGAVKVQNVEAAITSIVESVTRVKGIVDEVSESSGQQAKGISQVSQAITQMEKVTQTTAATSEESAAASEELSAQAETSRTLVEQLRVLAGTAGTASPAKAGKKPAAAGAPPAAKPRRAGLAAAGVGVGSAEAQLPLESAGTFGRF